MSKLLSTYFNPRSPHGERRRRIVEEDDDAYFNPRSPHGERLWRLLPRLLPLHFNPRSPHGERRRCTTRTSTLWRISIHAPRTGSDLRRGEICGMGRISIHAPRTGSDKKMANVMTRISLFQSTLPARGATRRRSESPQPSTSFQSTLPARGATCAVDQPHAGDGISIHAPRTGSDGAAAGAGLSGRAHFNPRSPHGERRSCAVRHGAVKDFNPRSPHGERRAPGICPPQSALFQSTLPARGATRSRRQTSTR